MSISQKEDLLNKNPHIESIIQPVMIVTAVGSIDGKMSDGWKEVLSKVAENHPTSPLADRYGRSSIKQNRTKEIIKKHVNKWKNM